MNGNIRAALAQYWADMGPLSGVAVPLAVLGVAAVVFGAPILIDLNESVRHRKGLARVEAEDRLVRWATAIGIPAAVGVLALLVWVGYAVWLNW